MHFQRIPWNNICNLSDPNDMLLLLLFFLLQRFKK